VALVALLVVPLPAITSPAQAQGDPQDLLILTDSVLLGMAPQYTGAVNNIIPQLEGDWTLTFDGQDGHWSQVGGAISRPGSAGPGLLDTYSDRRDDVVVIGLGYNDAWASSFSSSVTQMLDRLTTTDLVVLVTLRESGANASSFRAANQLFATEAANRANVVLADWATTSAGRGDVTWDGLHLTGTGANLVADLVAQTINANLPLCEEPVVEGAGAADASGSGYWILTDRGVVHAFGGAVHHGDLSTEPDAGIPISMESTPSGGGYWIVDDRGRVWTFGDAAHHGDVTTIGAVLNAPVTRLVAHPAGGGYWLMAPDGGVFSFGAADFHGSMGALPLNAPVISMAANEDGTGYWLIASDGGVFSFGVPFHGSTGSLTLNAPVTSMSVHPLGVGYWLYAGDGGVFTFGLEGQIGFYGSLPGVVEICSNPRAVQMRASQTGAGYWIVSDRGRVYAFGDAKHRGHEPTLASGERVIDLTIRYNTL
jgi:lysophospholipase L1-like esterase